jgi:hypothetical protein
LVQLGPCLDESPLTPWQIPGDQLNRIDTKNPCMILIVRMEVRRMVRSPDLHEHADYDSKEPADLWHVRILSLPA